MNTLESVQDALHSERAGKQAAIDDIRRSVEHINDLEVRKVECERTLADAQANFERTASVVADTISSLADAQERYERASAICDENGVKNIQSEIKDVHTLLSDTESEKRSEERILDQINDDLGKLEIEEEEKINSVEQQVIDAVDGIKCNLTEIDREIEESGEKELSIERQEQLIKQHLEILDKKESELNDIKKERNDVERSLNAVKCARELAEDDAKKRSVDVPVKETKEELKIVKDRQNKVTSDRKKAKRGLLFAKSEKRERLTKVAETSENNLKKLKIEMGDAKKAVDAAKADAKKEPARMRAARSGLSRIQKKEEKLRECLHEKENQVEIAEQEIASATIEFNKARSDLGWVRWNLSNLNDTYARKQRLIIDLEEEERRLEDVRNMRARTESFDELHTSRKESQNRLRGAEDTISALEPKLYNLERKAESTYLDIEAARGRLAEEERAIRETERSLIDGKSECQKAKESVQSKENNLKSVVEELLAANREITRIIPRILAEGSEVEAVEVKFELTAIEELESARNEIVELQSKHESLLSELIETRERSVAEDETQTALTTELESARNEIIALQSKHESLLSELTAANNEIAELREISGASDTEVALTTELESARNEITELQSMHESLLSELNSTRDNLTATNNEIAELKEAHVVPEGVQAPIDPHEVKELLTILDTMLENLPDDMIEEFANSDDFVLYKTVLDGYGV
ncbi:MAG: Chromosome partition protein Smc [Candidatus Methanogasteraceae archaeon]|nr:MAG: Chromosome partition protein Smc [ANME-2 cluster archaeon]